MRCAAIFDVCDTLFSTNTTVDFLHFLRANRGDKDVGVALDRWSARTSPCFYIGALAYRTMGWDLARARLVAALRGKTRGFLHSAAHDYVQNVLSGKIVEPVHERLREHLKRGDRVMLASASLDVVIAPVAEALGVEWVASVLQFVDGICTGCLVTDLTGGKAETVKKLVRPGETVHAYTDNRSDLDLLQIAQRRTVILPQGPPPRHWAGENCEYLQI